MNSFRLVPREKFLLGRRNEANFSDFSPNCHDQKWGLFRTFGSIESFSFQLGKSMKQEKYLSFRSLMVTRFIFQVNMYILNLVTCTKMLKCSIMLSCFHLAALRERDIMPVLPWYLAAIVTFVIFTSNGL